MELARRWNIKSGGERKKKRKKERKKERNGYEKNDAVDNLDEIDVKIE